MRLLTVRQNNAQELRDFDDTCQRLEGFDGALNFENVDGFLTALAAGPQLPPVDDWLAALCGDAFERAFSDPQAHGAALRALKTRLAVLRDQLDPEALMDAPDELRLFPLMSEWTEAMRQEAAADAEMGADEAAGLVTGASWAAGFFLGAEAFPQLWQAPQGDEELTGLYEELWAQIDALLLPEGAPALAVHIAKYFPPAEASAPGPTRDDLVVQACYAVQDLRLFWVDHAPRPETRRVEKAPGRNDPCPCGSGKKFKKCHGAAGAQA